MASVRVRQGGTPTAPRGVRGAATASAGGGARTRAGGTPTAPRGVVNGGTVRQSTARSGGGSGD